MSTSPQMTAAQANSIARQLILARSVRMQQQIFTQTFDPVANPVLTVQPRNVGLILGFYVKVTATANNTNVGAGGGSLAPTGFGPANMVSQFSFTDLENNVRIQTPGWHLTLVDSLKARRVWGSALVKTTGEDSVLGYGANYSIDLAPTVTAGAGTGTYQKWYWVPLAYSESDFRGAIYANVTNATLQLVMQFNQTPFATNPANPFAYVATGNTGYLSNMTVTVHQVYLDQLPMGQNGGVILPTLDLTTIYELKQTAYQGLTVSTDFPMLYANFRDFLSTCAVYYNGTAGAGGLTNGTDINLWSLRSANFTNIWQMPPDLIALRTRNHMGVDLPAGCSYFGSRNKPISTIQYGNMELVLNPSTAGATAQVLLAFEDFALKNVVAGAGSLSGN